MSREPIDRSDPLLRMSERAAVIHCGDKFTNEARPLTAWAAMMYMTAREVRRWVIDRPQDWEIVKMSS